MKHHESLSFEKEKNDLKSQIDILATKCRASDDSIKSLSEDIELWKMRFEEIKNKLDSSKSSTATLLEDERNNRQASENELKTAINSLEAQVKQKDEQLKYFETTSEKQAKKFDEQNSQLGNLKLKVDELKNAKVLRKLYILFQEI